MFAARGLRLVRSAAARTAVRNMGSHGPLMPPFARLPPPTGTIHEENEWVWDDTVAPEGALDLDSQDQVTGAQALGQFGMMMAFVFGLLAISKWEEPEKNSPVVSRAAVLNDAMFQYDIGLLDELPEEEH